MEMRSVSYNNGFSIRYQQIIEEKHAEGGERLGSATQPFLTGWKTFGSACRINYVSLPRIGINFR